MTLLRHQVTLHFGVLVPVFTGTESVTVAQDVTEL